MEYGLLATFSIFFIIVLLVVIDKIRTRNSKNFFYTLSYLEKKKKNSQDPKEESINRDNVRKASAQTKKWTSHIYEESTDSIYEENADNVRKATSEHKKWEDDNGKKCMEAQKLESIQENLESVNENLFKSFQTRSFEKINQESLEDTKKTEFSEGNGRKEIWHYYNEDETLLEKITDKRDITRRIEKEEFERKQNFFSPDKTQKISSSAGNAIRNNSIPIEKEATKPKVFFACKDTDRIDAGQNDLPKNISEKEWQDMLVSEDIARESPSEYEKAIQKLDALSKELQEIPHIPTVDEVYYEFLLEEKQKDSIDYSIEGKNTSFLSKEDELKTLSLFSCIERYPKDPLVSSKVERKEDRGHSKTIEKWKKMIKWNER